MLVAATGCSGDDDDDGGEADGGDVTSTTMATGGIEIDAPDGWTEIPMPILAFGVALPPGWEAVRLDAAGLSSVSQAEPEVPGFAAAAHDAAALGAVFYAAGVDAAGRVVDLTVEAFDGAGATDGAALETLARELAEGRSWTSPSFAVVADAARPTVDVRFTAEASRPTPVTDDAPDETETVPVDGVERLVVSPAGVAYSFVLTSDDAEAYADLTSQILATIAFPP